MRDLDGKFTNGIPLDRRFPVGSIRIRTRHKRNGERRAFIKIAEPNTWGLLAQYVWEKDNGPIPSGFGIHHKDRNKLNDDPGNLELKSKRDHLAEHRPEFSAKSVATWTEKRRELRWSTRSKAGKITGRHPTDCACPIHAQ